MDVSKTDGLAKFAETYGIAVRAGLITPNLDDEIAAREMFGLPPVNDAVRAEWEKTKGVRSPITLAGGASVNAQQIEGSTP